MAGTSLLGGIGATAAPSGAQAGYPPFGWEQVPVAADIGKHSGNFTDSEVAFLAKHFSLLSLEKGFAIDAQPADRKFYEPGFFTAAQRLKAANPKIKILFFWGAKGYIPSYETARNIDPSWLIPIGDSKVERYDLRNPQLRAWWADVAAKIVAHDNVDGVFVDGIDNFHPDPDKYALFGELRERLDALGKPTLIIFNGLATPPPGEPSSLLNLADGVMIEHFGAFEAKSPDAIKNHLLQVRALGKAGKIAIVHAWPGFTFLDPFRKTAPYEQLVETARKNITFPLACFLAAAGRFSYLQYGWGFENVGGMFFLESDQQTVDPAWYPELLRPLGAPLADATIDGYVFSRQFEHAAVRVDLQRSWGNINWG